MSELNQISLFRDLSDDNKQEYEELRLKALKSKRIRYKNPTQIKFYEEDIYSDGSKTDSILLWGNMNRLYVELANRFPFPTAFEQRNDIIEPYVDTYYVEYGMIRTFKVCYYRGKYKHRGDDGIIKEYDGEEFFYNYAEIIDSEDLGVNERLFLHNELINYLDDGYKLEKLNMWLETLVNMFKQGWTVKLLIIHFLFIGGNNEN